MLSSNVLNFLDPGIHRDDEILINHVFMDRDYLCEIVKTAKEVNRLGRTGRSPMLLSLEKMSWSSFLSPFH